MEVIKEPHRLGKIITKENGYENRDYSVCENEKEKCNEFTLDTYANEKDC